MPGQLADLFNTNNNPDAPKAHLNYLFFNDKLELLPGNSGSVQVPVNPTGWVTLNPSLVTGGTAVQTGQIATAEPGYVIIYIDNQSIGKEVWFDNLMVGHYYGEILEEDHYYPFGLTLTKPMSQPGLKNYFKYNTKELETKFGLETYDYGARSYNPQISRWNNIDAYADSYLGFSPYNYVLNNPVIFIDPDGNNMDWYERDNGDGSTSVAFRPGSEETVEINGETYKNAGKEIDRTSSDGSSFHGDVDGNASFTIPDINIGGKPLPYTGARMKSSDGYNYSTGSESKSKRDDDWSYIKNGKDGWWGSRWYKTYERDVNNPKNAETVQDVQDFKTVVESQVPILGFRPGSRGGGGNRPPNLSPPNSGRTGALREALRRNGVPTSQQPTRVLKNLDRRGSVQPGRVYEYDVPKPGGGTKTIRIRDDAGGHNYGPNNPQNRGPHFNDEAGNHYDY